MYKATTHTTDIVYDLGSGFQDVDGWNVIIVPDIPIVKQGGAAGLTTPVIVKSHSDSFVFGSRNGCM